MAVDGSTLALYFSEPLKAVMPSRNRFLVFVNGVRNFANADPTLTNGDTIRLALTTPIPAGATVSISYLNVNGFDRFGYGDIRSTRTNQIAAFFRTRATSNLTGSPAASVSISSSTASLRVGKAPPSPFLSPAIQAAVSSGMAAQGMWSYPAAPSPPSPAAA